MPPLQLLALHRRRKSADRFHVMKNLGEALEGFLARHFAAHRTRVVQEESTTPLPTVQGKGPPKVSPKQAAVSQAKREERLAQYEHVVADAANRASRKRPSPRRLGIGHATVSRWLSSDAFPEQKPRQCSTQLDPHLKEVAERWEAGCHNIAGVTSGTGSRRPPPHIQISVQTTYSLPSRRAEECGLS
jgi:hypothetical protein